MARRLVLMDDPLGSHPVNNGDRLPIGGKSGVLIFSLDSADDLLEIGKQ